MTVTNTTPPVISGTARQGQILGTTNGTWTFDEDYLTYAYRWLRCDSAGANCNPIGGATSSSYLLTAADVGSRIRSEVTATEHTGSSGRPPDPPNGYGGQVVINTGGNYEVAAQTSGTNPAVIINTSQSVTLTGWVKNLSSGGTLIDAIPGGAVNLTVENLWAYGAQTVPNNVSPKRFLWTQNHQSLTVRNCTIVNTGGIEVNSCANNSTVLITRNRHTNIQGYVTKVPLVVRVGNFVQFRICQTMSSCEVSWNEILNEYNKSWSEDIVSIYHTNDVQCFDNYMEHQSTPGNVYTTPQQSSQNGITIDSSDAGLPCNDNYVARNQIVDGFGIVVSIGSGGSNNLVEDNTIVSDRLLPNGANKANGLGVPLAITSGGSNNHAHNNTMCWIDRDGAGVVGNPGDYDPASVLGGAAEGGAAEAANNTYCTPSDAMENAEWTAWQAKLTANGIIVGA